MTTQNADHNATTSNATTSNATTSNATSTDRNRTNPDGTSAHGLGYEMPDEAAEVHLYVNNARDRAEVEILGDLVRPYVSGGADPAIVRATLAEVAERSPGAVLGFIGWLSCNRAYSEAYKRAEDTVLVLLREAYDSVALADGSAYRSKSNPNPDAFDVEDIQKHGSNGPYNPLPAVNVKVHRGFKKQDFEDVRGDLGLDEGTLAPTGRFLDEDDETCDEDAPGARPELLPFGEAWIDARYDLDDWRGGRSNRSSELYEGPEAWTREQAWEDAQERAQELFGSNVKVWSAGRQGGWALVEGLPDYEALASEVEDDAEALEELATLRARNDDATSQDEDALDEDERERLEELESDEADMRERARELEEFLGAWAEWEAYCAAVVEDFPRAVAWSIGANVFQPEAEEYLAELEREQAEREAAEAARVAELEREREERERMQRERDEAQEEANRIAGELGPLADYARNVLAEVRERGLDKAPELDADGFPIRSALENGLARDGFYTIAEDARSRGLLDE